MLREFDGIPLHALLVHATVVLVPALVLAAVGYVSLPWMRARIGWLAGGLAVLTPLAAFLTMQSGEELRDVLIAKGYPAEILNQVAEHQEYGERTFWFTLGLAAFTGLRLLADRDHPRLRALPRWVGLVLTAGVVAFGVLAAAYVYLAGDSGAHVVWQGVL